MVFASADVVIGVQDRDGRSFICLVNYNHVIVLRDDRASLCGFGRLCLALDDPKPVSLSPALSRSLTT